MKISKKLLTTLKKDPRRFPKASEVDRFARHFKAEANEEGGFSSPELTAWYVTTFQDMNSLRFV